MNHVSPKFRKLMLKLCLTYAQISARCYMIINVACIYQNLRKASRFKCIAFSCHKSLELLYGIKFMQRILCEHIIMKRINQFLPDIEGYNKKHMNIDGM
jgi:hypothetical protein